MLLNDINQVENGVICWSLTPSYQWVAFTTNLVYVVFKSNTKLKKMFFPYSGIYPLCYLQVFPPPPIKTSHRKKSNAEYTGKRKLFLIHVGDWFAFWIWCFVTHIIFLAWKYLWVIIKLTFSTNIQSATCMLLTSSRRPCPGWLFYVSYF